MIGPLNLPLRLSLNIPRTLRGEISVILQCIKVEYYFASLFNIVEGLILFFYQEYLHGYISSQLCTQILHNEFHRVQFVIFKLKFLFKNITKN